MVKLVLLWIILVVLSVQQTVDSNINMVLVNKDIAQGVILITNIETVEGEIELLVCNTHFIIIHKLNVYQDAVGM